MTALSFALRNDSTRDSTAAKGGTGQVPLFFSRTTSVSNRLIATVIITGGAASTLSASTVPGSGATLRVDLTGVVSADNLRQITAVLPGWDMAPPVAGVLQLSPVADIVLATQTTLELTLDGVVCDPNAWPSGRITIALAHVPGIRFGSEHTFAMAVTAAPQAGERDLDLQFAWAPSDNGTPLGGVVVSRAGIEGHAAPPAILNDLAFTITNPNLFDPVVPVTATWDPAQPPTFVIRFDYGDPTTASHALCSRDFWQNHPPPDLAIAPQDAAHWVTATHLTTEGSPYWLLQPTPDNQRIFGARGDIDAAGPSPPVVRLLLPQLVSDLPLDGGAGIALMYIQWENIPGCLASNMALPINKLDTFQLFEVSSEPSSEQPIPAGSEVTLSWRTHGAEFCSLQGAPGVPLEVVDVSRVGGGVSTGNLAGDGLMGATFVMPSRHAEETITVSAHRFGQPDQRRSLTFGVAYPPLVFTQALSISPTVGVTRSIEGITDASGNTAPPTRLALAWQVDRPELVGHYTVHIDCDSPGAGGGFSGEHSLEATRIDAGGNPIGSADVAVPDSFLASRQACHGGHVGIRIVAHAVYDDNVMVDSSAVLTLWPPVELLRLDVRPCTETSSIELDWGMLLYPWGPECICEYRLFGDTRLAESFTLEMGHPNGVEHRALSAPGTPFGCDSTGARSHVYGEGASPDLFDILVRAPGRGGDVAVVRYLGSNGKPGKIKTVDRFLRGARFRFTPPADYIVHASNETLRVDRFDLVIGDDGRATFDGVPGFSVRVESTRRIQPQPSAIDTGTPEFFGTVASGTDFPDAEVILRGDLKYAAAEDATVSTALDLVMTIGLTSLPTASLSFNGGATQFALTLIEAPGAQ